MPLLATKDRYIFFAHIPKTAGSSVKRYLLTKGELYLSSSTVPAGLSITPQHFHAELYTGMLPPSLLAHSFAVLRDPLARMVSEYKYRSVAPPAPWPWINRITGTARMHVKYGHRRRVMSFDRWVAATLRAYRKSPTIYDNHIRPQVEFLSGVQKLFVLEDGLEQVFRWIDMITETPPEPGFFHENKSSGYSVSISENTHAAICSFYADDYRLLERVKHGS